jgi:hypothetical protein
VRALSWQHAPDRKPAPRSNIGRGRMARAASIALARRCGTSLGARWRACDVDRRASRTTKDVPLATSGTRRARLSRSWWFGQRQGALVLTPSCVLLPGRPWVMMRLRLRTEKTLLKLGCKKACQWLWRGVAPNAVQRRRRTVKHGAFLARPDQRNRPCSNDKSRCGMPPSEPLTARVVRGRPQRRPPGLKSM